MELIYRVCFTYLGSQADAEDAVQTTFLNLFRVCKEGKSIRNVQAWLITCAKNCCTSILRRSHRKEAPLADWYAHTDERDETRELLYQLPKPERLALYLHYYEGYTAKEIGAMLEKTETTVWSYLHKGRKKLKKLIEEDIA
ncbi:MAG: RNA polymerase sigma factor [Clostridiales bacterium]|nr:RNA polymerase sigma factor [Clostridiales bacterium]